MAGRSSTAGTVPQLDTGYFGIQDFVRASARRAPEAISFVLPGGTQFTFEETNTRINQLASALADAGVRPGRRVALMATDSHRYMETMLAILKLGATAVPLNFRLTRSEVEVLLGKAQPNVLFFSDRYADMLTGIGDACPSLELQVCLDGPSEGAVDYENLIRGQAQTEPDVGPIDPNSIAAIAFTSGTTGLPKGVQQSYAMLGNLVKNNIINYKTRPEYFWYCSSPLFHVAGFAFPMMGVALAGKSLILPQFDAAEILRFVDSDMGLNALFLVPTMVSSLLALPEAKTADWSSLRMIAYGSAPMPPALLQRAIDLIGCGFVNTFGAGTEAGSQTVMDAEEHRVALASHPHRLGSIGKASFSCELRLCDENWNDVPRGEIGEIVTRSDTVMSGYLDMPDETAAAFNDGWFRAGDLAYEDEDGFLYIKGRSKDMIIRGGENIYPSEIEHVLAGHPAVEISSVVGLDDDRWGQQVRAWVVRNRGVTVDAETLREYCRDHLAAYKVPNEFLFVDDLPRNASGKILKRELVKWDAPEDQRSAQ